MALAYPEINPVALSIGPVLIRWYALAYISGLLLGRFYVGRLVRYSPFAMTEEQVDDFLLWATLGVVLGGRLGYVLFYKPGYYFTHLSEIPAMWHGGMSFHGGALGVILAVIFFTRAKKLSLLAVGDVICCAEPIGQFFGRIANFINGELFGRVAPDVPWAMVFPRGGPEPRHPSQLYQAGLEGLSLFLVLFALWFVPSVRQKPGTLAGVYFAGYGVARIIGEIYRQPDPFLNFLVGDWLTMGQALSAPLVLFGIGLAWWAQTRPALPMTTHRV